MKERTKDFERISYKFRLRPSKSQQRLLIQWMGACRFVYNCGLEQRINAYNRCRKSLSYNDQQKELVECKKTEGLEWLREVPSQSLQMALRNLDRAYQNFFRRVKEGVEAPGFPKEKKKGKHIDSITFPQGDRFYVSCKTKKSFVFGLPKLKGGIKIVQHRPIEGKIKSATITHKSGEWYISFSCKREALKRSFNQEKAIGIDLGVAKTICTNKDNLEFNLDLKSIKKIEKKISKLQRKEAKQKKFSPRWNYFQNIIRKKHSKIARIRQDFLHKTSHNICKGHAIVILEKLVIKNMTKSASGTIEEPGKLVAKKSALNKSILRQGWGMFRWFCEYKTNRFGGHTVLINPKNTSRRCSKCGHISESNRKNQADFSCEKCGHTENADKNAAKNILALGLQSLGIQTLEAPTIVTKVA